MVGSSFRGQSTIFGYLSASCRELASKLSRLDDYWNATGTVNTTANQAYSSAPAEAWKLLALRVTLNGKRDRIKLASPDEIDMESSLVGWASAWPRYRWRGERLLWSVTPLAVHVVTAEYLPHAIFKDNGGTPKSELTATTDTFDGVFGWDDWATIHTAIRLRNDAGKDIASLKLELQEREEEIFLAAADRQNEEPGRVRTTWGSTDDEERCP